MAVEVEVINRGSKVVGRLNRTFPPNEPVRVRVSPWLLPEITRAPMLHVKLISADTVADRAQAEAVLKQS